MGDRGPDGAHHHGPVRWSGVVVGEPTAGTFRQRRAWPWVGALLALLMVLTWEHGTRERVAAVTTVVAGVIVTERLLRMALRSVGFGAAGGRGGLRGGCLLAALGAAAWVGNRHGRRRPDPEPLLRARVELADGATIGVVVHRHDEGLASGDALTMFGPRVLGEVRALWVRNDTSGRVLTDLGPALRVGTVVALSTGLALVLVA